MNLQSWIFLLVILGICSYIVYTRFIKEGSNFGCKDCAQKSSCSSDTCHSKKEKTKKKSCPYCDWLFFKGRTFAKNKFAKVFFLEYKILDFIFLAICNYQNFSF